MGVRKRGGLRIWTPRALLCLLILAPLTLVAHPKARATLRLVGGFRPLDRDARVWYEPGAETYAERIADALPRAVAVVETGHGAPFVEAFRVYVSATHERFTRRLAYREGSPVRGTQTLWDVWVSPLSFSFHGQDTHRQTLTHELSHLHLVQHLGWLEKTRTLPTWYVEGLADWLADTGGEQVSLAEARAGIRSGRCFVPDSSGHLPFPKTARDYGVGWPLFHRQARTFVESLVARDEEAFAALIVAVESGETFDGAFRRLFGAPVESVWRAFLKEASRH